MPISKWYKKRSRAWPRIDHTLLAPECGHSLSLGAASQSELFVQAGVVGVVVEVVGSILLGASIGDSGAWLIDGSRIVDLTANQRRKPLLGSGYAHPVRDLSVA